MYVTAGEGETDALTLGVGVVFTFPFVVILYCAFCPVAIVAVIVALPFPIIVTVPLLLTVATEELLLLYFGTSGELPGLIMADIFRACPTLSFIVLLRNLIQIGRAHV